MGWGNILERFGKNFNPSGIFPLPVREHLFNNRPLLVGMTAAQILLTRFTMQDEEARSNAHNTFDELLKMGAVPIVNENDTVSTYEIRFGDNDRLSALVSSLKRVPASWASRPERARSLAVTAGRAASRKAEWEASSGRAR